MLCMMCIVQLQEAVLTKWTNDAQRMDRRLLSLIYMAYSSDVLENAFAPLNDDDYELAMKRVRELMDLDFDAESAKPNTNECIWAVVSAFVK
jgi:Golgi phosphoprotein 3